MIRRALRFLRDRRGVAAVEFAIIAPVIAGIALTSYALWDLNTRRQNMATALDLSAEYLMNGGDDDLVARNLALTAWANKPGDAAVTTARICRCGDAVIDCSSTCAEGVSLATYVHMNASGTDNGALSHKSLTLTRMVRVD